MKSGETKTLRQLLDEGVELLPIQHSPFLYCKWQIGFFYNGIPHAAFKDRFNTSQECVDKIKWLLNTYYYPIQSQNQP